MWRTPRGERTLSGAEGLLIRELLGNIYDEIDFIDESFGYGVKAFDQLTVAQQLAMLAEVGTALLDSAVPSPALTAVREATIATLFAALRGAIAFESDHPDLENSTYWREMLLAAYIEQCGDDPDLPAASCDDLGEWELIMEGSSSQLLWDADWNMDDLFVDADPVRSTYLKSRLRISDDYFTAIAPDPTDVEMDSLRLRLDALTGVSHRDIDG